MRLLFALLLTLPFCSSSEAATRLLLLDDIGSSTRFRVYLEVDDGTIGHEPGATRHDSGGS